VGCSKRSVNFAIAVALGLLLAGCSTKAGWEYQPSAIRVAATPLPVTVAVEHFQDQRGTENSRYFWVCVIPLVPYCTSDYKRPENANGFLTEASYNFRPSDDLAQATSAELRQAGLFREVYVTDRTSDPNAQLAIRGNITFGPPRSCRSLIRSPQPMSLSWALDSRERAKNMLPSTSR